MNQKHVDEPYVLPAAGKRPGEHDWKPGSDVQSLWRRYGWTPPSQHTHKATKPSDSTHPPLHLLRG
jgi:hypothetical protein